MRAVVKARANTETVELAEVPVPHISADEVLVRVAAIGVGIHDSYFLPRDAHYPYPIGIEAAGVVEEVGSRACGLRTGDRIAFVSSMQPKGGTWAEYAAVTADSLLVPVPDGLDLTEAAAVPVAGNTALRALEALEPVPEGGSLFVSGGAGAIGTLAVQLARARGWRVGASASEHNHDYLRALGAELTVDYHDPGWPDLVRQWLPTGVDAAIAVHPGTTSGCLPVVRDGGRLISISGDATASVRGVDVDVVSHVSDVRVQLAQLLVDISEKRLHLEIAGVHPFEEALTALAQVQTRHTRGKLVLRME